MTATITWKAPTTERYTADGFIHTAHYECTGTDGEFSGRVYSTCSFPAGTPSIPYAQVTEQDVLNWIWESGVDKDATEAAVLAQIEAQKNPVTALGTPWGN